MTPPDHEGRRFEPSRREASATATLGDRRTAQIVRVFDEDPELLNELEPDAAAKARRHTVTEALTLHRGKLPSFSRALEDGHQLGLLVLEGVLIRRVGVGGGLTAELVGAGDVLWPLEGSAAFASVPIRASWKVCESSRLAVLDRAFWAAAARWPEIMAQLGARTAQRADSLVVLRAITRLQRLDVRLRALLWHLADRWGRVELGGTALPLQLSQQTLADIAGAGRQSVNLALKHLLDQGVIERRTRGGWLLKGDPPAESGSLLPG